MQDLSSKATNRVALNRSLLAMIVGVFFLTINLTPGLLEKKILAFQLIIAMPLLVTSVLAYSKIGYHYRTERWNWLGWATFTIAYAFILNVVGILIAQIIGAAAALVFFAASWVCMMFYSGIDISYHQSKIRQRILKDGLFVIIQILFGVLVVLELYWLLSLRLQKLFQDLTKVKFFVIIKTSISRKEVIIWIIPMITAPPP